MDWLHFQGLFKYLTFLGAIAYACQWARPEIAVMLDFDRERILAGEVWRLFTFLIAPMASQSFSPLGAVFMFIAVRVAFLISDSLEDVWGSTRMTLYILVGWFCLAASLLVFDFANYGAVGAGTMLLASLFFAFATNFPKVELSLAFVIPVEVRILGAIAAVLLVLNGLIHPQSLTLALPAMVPYFLWVLPNVIHGRKSLVKAAQRRRKFNVSKLPESIPFHQCEVCRRTERDPQDLEFFVMPDGKEYCTEHLPPQA